MIVLSEGMGIKWHDWHSPAGIPIELKQIQQAWSCNERPPSKKQIIVCYINAVKLEVMVM